MTPEELSLMVALENMENQYSDGDFIRIPVGARDLYFELCDLRDEIEDREYAAQGGYGFV